MINKFKKNIHTWRDVCLFFRILRLITVLPVLIKYHTLPGLLTRLTPSNQAPSMFKTAESPALEKIVKYTDFILGRGIGAWKRTCLTRSLVLYHFLWGSGVPVEISFGVRLPKSSDLHAIRGRLEGHAWLRYDGSPFLESDPDMALTYAETYRFPLPNPQHDTGSLPTAIISQHRGST
jgi:hypothetical protein